MTKCTFVAISYLRVLSYYAEERSRFYILKVRLDFVTADDLYMYISRMRAYLYMGVLKIHFSSSIRARNRWFI